MAPLTITELYAFIANEQPGEGVAAVQIEGTMFPLIGADRDRVDSLRKMAQQVADLTGKKLTLAKFSIREDLEVIERSRKSNH